MFKQIDIGAINCISRSSNYHSSFVRVIDVLYLFTIDIGVMWSVLINCYGRQNL